MSESDEPAEPPRLPIPGRTLVQQRDGTTLLSFDGLLALPIGARIELDNGLGYPQVPLDAARFANGRADAIVVGVYVTATQGPAGRLVLEVELSRPGENAPP